MDKAESKFKNTAEKMNLALIKLIDEKNFENISVSEICAEAGVNRSTFYAHYQNTRDFLKETRTNILKKFREQYNETGILFKDDKNMFPTDELELISSKFLIPYLKFVKENMKSFKAYMNNLSTFEADKTFNYVV